MLILRRMRDRQLADGLVEHRNFYASPRTPDDVRRVQLDSLNGIWEHISSAIPYYGELLRSGTTPRRFNSLEEFRDTVPITSRAIVRSDAARMTDPTIPVDFVRATGGSTGEPVRIGASNSELTVSNCNAWHARGWFGVVPSDKLFMIWGHSHLLGSGVRGWINGRKRELKDRVLGYCRHSAYDLSDAALRQAGEKLLRQRPAWIYSYAVGLDRFADVNRARRDDFRALKLKVAIATAEAFPRSDSAAQIADVLGCPVAMEYGSVETGVMSQQGLDGHYFFFWRDHLLEGIPAEGLPGCHEILITSLYPRCFPLMRYRIGDLISEDPSAPDFEQHFANVIGRRDEYVDLPDGTRVHTAAFTHAVREVAAISRYQVVQSRDGEIGVQYLSDAPLRETDLAEIRRRLAIVHPDLASTRIEQANELPQTVSGKLRRLVREDNHA